MNKYVRCLWIVDTLNNYGKCTLKELNDRWINSTLNDEGEEILPRTFFRNSLEIRSSWTLSTTNVLGNMSWWMQTKSKVLRW